MENVERIGGTIYRCNVCNNLGEVVLN